MHYLTRDYQFPGDAKFPKGTLAAKYKSIFTMVDKHGHTLGAHTGEPVHGTACADHGTSYEDEDGLFRAIPGVRKHVEDVWRLTMERAEAQKVAFRTAREFAERRERKKATKP